MLVLLVVNGKNTTLRALVDAALVDADAAAAVWDLTMNLLLLVERPYIVGPNAIIVTGCGER